MHVQIKEYESQWKNNFYELNHQWIEKYFKMEDEDYKILQNPEEYVIQQGGYIFFALYENMIVGTAALLKHDEKRFELAKMATNEHYRNQGIAQKLIHTCITKAREKGADSIFLNSNTILKPAIQLYQKIGFKEIPIKSTCYSRCNIQMELKLDEVV